MYVWVIKSDYSYLTEQSYNPEAHVELMEFLERNSLNDGDEFCATLMRESPRHKSLGTHTYRSHNYCEELEQKEEKTKAILLNSTLF